MKSRHAWKLADGEAVNANFGPDGAQGKAPATFLKAPGPKAYVPNTVRAIRAAAVLALAAMAVAGGGSVLAGCTKPRPAAAGAQIGGAFHLIDQDGHAVDQHLLDGKWSAVFFGYTYCPDSCPATLQALGAAARQLGAATPFQTVFITVDPARDTPAEMKTYLQNQGFPAHAVGLTGTPAEIAAAAKAYSVYYAKSGTGADYTVDQSAAVYLMDPHGRFARPLAHDMAPALIAQQIQAAEQVG
jgi:protein SCO1/2